MSLRPGGRNGSGGTGTGPVEGAAHRTVTDPTTASGTVAVVVVNYESGPALAHCVDGLLSEGPAELVVVDNGSADGSLRQLRDRFPHVEVLVPGRNLGYGAGANRGVAATSAPTVLVCNPDLEVRPGALADLSAALAADPGCAVVGPLIRDQAGERYPSARQFPGLVDAAGHALLGIFAPDNRFTRSYQKADLGGAGPGPEVVDWVSGACFLARRSAFEQVGGFDESYFMYLEEVDLCWRLGQGGWRVAYVPSAEVTHLQGLSTERHPFRMIYEHHRSLMRFATSSSQGWRRALLPLVAVGIGTRACLACLARVIRT